jgi:RNA polymerase sigma factor (sigma-70 family)
MQAGMWVYVVDDDHEHVLALVRMLAQLQFPARRFASIADLLSDAPDDRLACVLAERAPGGVDALELLEGRGGRDCPWPVIFLTGHGDVAHCAAAMRGGAVDYLVKPASAAVLLEALARAETQGTEWARAQSERAVLRALLARLTQRERQVLELVLTGRRNKEIAAALASQEATVKVHRSRLMRKLETRSLADLMRFREILASAALENEAAARARLAELGRFHRALHAHAVAMDEHTPSH